MKAGLLFRLGSFWLGLHWSRYNRRFCINLIPCITIWITLAGGVAPLDRNSLGGWLAICVIASAVIGYVLVRTGVVR